MGYSIGQQSYTPFSALQKVLLDNATLETQPKAETRKGMNKELEPKEGARWAEFTVRFPSSEVSPTKAHGQYRRWSPESIRPVPRGQQECQDRKPVSTQSDVRSGLLQEGNRPESTLTMVTIAPLFLARGDTSLHFVLRGLAGAGVEVAAWPDLSK